MNGKGEALVTYSAPNGKVRHVLVWGAVNAATLRSTRRARQIRFKWDYAGGWGKYRNASYWKRVKNALRSVRRPAARHTSSRPARRRTERYWAIQSWQRGLPLLGFDPWQPAQTAYELHLSHWSGDLAEARGLHPLDVRRLSGRASSAGFTYLGQPMLRLRLDGGRATRATATAATSTSTRSTRPTEPGWRRESGILVHKPTGTFCHSFVPQKPFPGYPSQEMRPPAPGEKYRVTVMGPGVTPVSHGRAAA